MGSSDFRSLTEQRAEAECAHERQASERLATFAASNSSPGYLRRSRLGFYIKVRLSITRKMIWMLVKGVNWRRIFLFSLIVLLFSLFIFDDKDEYGFLCLVKLQDT